MFENMSEAQAKEGILKLASEYYHVYKGEKEFSKGDYIPYAKRVFDEKEMMNLVHSSLEFWLTSGRYTDQFEEQFSSFLGIKYCTLVNSGSSANLIAFMALTSSILGERAIKRGDEVITIAAAFPTTVAPIIQFGAKPVFVDVTIPQYNIDVSMLEMALSHKTKAVMVAHTLGNPFDLSILKSFCTKHDLWLIEDNCDALGSKYLFNYNMKYTGTIGDIGTSSFYPPHHMTMGEGGAVYSDDPLLNKIIRSLRDWGRDCICPSGKDNLCTHRFDKKYGDLPIGYDHKYVYSHFGYNLKATDMQAAIGCAQLEKLPYFIKQRKKNFDRIKEGLSIIKDKVILPEAFPRSEPSWFGFLITCKEGLNRNALVKNLEENGIQTRMLFAGNLIKHPCFKDLKMDLDYRVISDLKNTNRIMNDSFWIGVYPGLTSEMIDYMVEIIVRYANNRGKNDE